MRNSKQAQSLTVKRTFRWILSRPISSSKSSLEDLMFECAPVWTRPTEETRCSHPKVTIRSIYSRIISAIGMIMSARLLPTAPKSTWLNKSYSNRLTRRKSATPTPSFRMKRSDCSTKCESRSVCLDSRNIFSATFARMLITVFTLLKKSKSAVV